MKKNSGSKVMTEEEVKIFLEENPKIKLWSDEDIPEWKKRAEAIGTEEGYNEDYKNEESGISIESKVVSSGTLEIRSSISVWKMSPSLIDYDYAWEYDNMMADFAVLHQFSPHQSMNVYHSKSPIRWIVSPRDFVYLSYRRPLEDGTFIILLKSIEEYEGYPEKSGVVRGLIHYTFYYIKPHPTNKDVTNSDGKGNVPKKITNYLTRKLAPSWIKNLMSYLARYPEYLYAKKKKEKQKKLKEEEEEGEEGEN